MAIINPKRISELDEAKLLSDQDLLVINVYNSNAGYTLTKKVTSRTLGEFIGNTFIKPYLSDHYELSDLAHYDLPKLLNKMMERSHGGGKGNESLALSAIGDLQLGDLSSTNFADLHLDLYALKNFATGVVNVGPNEFINGIIQQDGKITGVSKGRIKDEVPIDSQLDPNSENPVQNAVVKAALDTKMNSSDGNMDYYPIEGEYIAGFSQRNGKVRDIVAYKLPKQPIDKEINQNSSNPVENKVIAAKINEVVSKITSDANNEFVSKNYANSYLKANVGEYIKAIKQIDGKITAIETGATLDIITNVVADLKALRDQVNSQINDLKNYVDSTFLRLNTAASLTVTGPVKFNAKITGTITTADLATKAKWA